MTCISAQIGHKVSSDLHRGPTARQTPPASTQHKNDPFSSFYGTQHVNIPVQAGSASEPLQATPGRPSLAAGTSTRRFL